MELFDYLKALTEKTPNDEPDFQFEKDFNPFMINRFMSCERPLVLLSNELNRVGFTKRMVFDLYYHTIPKGKRYIKYSAKKAARDKHLKYLMDHYSCSIEVAKQYLALMSEEELKKITEYNEKRGVK